MPLREGPPLQNGDISHNYFTKPKPAGCTKRKRLLRLAIG